ncbi:MAG: DeoR family transcriptional regulator [Sphingomonas bacterium]|uniref:helix-turn-helix transcriptional regulator n=1 Tax=Sphingomonas bacterium TaxID=1895847 RepID=UPI002637A197|nr:YafY family protein [Sphingomonas bacterium]MDB5707104.1 DeoR family transcriptional regulator [Sphingomonas bacterium]
MRRADRLFEIVQILRRERRPVTADAIATELESSKRSVYRDIAALMAQRVPIRGEAGIGYVLEGGFDLPPLMLNPEEVEAAVLGAQWVAGHGDPALARAARNLIAKIAAVVPAEMRPLLVDPAARTPPAWGMAEDAVDATALRQAIRAGRKIALSYRAENGTLTDRTIWPALLGYHDSARMLIGWCELREDFRSFRLDRIVVANFLDERYPTRPATLRARWLAQLERPGVG